MTSLIWSFPDPNWKFCYNDFRAFAMPFSLVSLLLPMYFDMHDRITVGTEIYGDSRVSLKKLWVYYSLFGARWFLFVCIKLFRYFSYLSVTGFWQGGREGMFVSQKSFPVLSLAKTVCYWKTVVLWIGLFSTCACTECSTWTEATRSCFPFWSALLFFVNSCFN